MEQENVSREGELGVNNVLERAGIRRVAPCIAAVCYVLEMAAIPLHNKSMAVYPNLMEREKYTVLVD